QPDPVMAESIWGGVSVTNLFARPRIVIADDYSKSVFVCSQINRIDFIFEGSDFSQLPHDHADLVELDAEEFCAHVPVDDPVRLERRVHSRRAGDLLVHPTCRRARTVKRAQSSNNNNRIYEALIC